MSDDKKVLIIYGDFMQKIRAVQAGFDDALHDEFLLVSEMKQDVKTELQDIQRQMIQIKLNEDNEMEKVQLGMSRVTRSIMAFNAAAIFAKDSMLNIGSFLRTSPRGFQLAGKSFKGYHCEQPTNNVKNKRPDQPRWLRRALRVKSFTTKKRYQKKTQTKINWAIRLGLRVA